MKWSKSSAEHEVISGIKNAKLSEQVGQIPVERKKKQEEEDSSA